MKKYIIICVLLFLIWSNLWSNPIVVTHISEFAELVFDDSNNWTMELYFPFGYEASIVDSIIIKVSTGASKLKANFQTGIFVAVITSDSLSNHISINRNGDYIEIYTYATENNNQAILTNGIRFGDYLHASVGQPVAGYSIIRNNLKANNNYLTIDCLTKNPTLGAVNDTLGLGGIMKGNIYDKDNNPVTKLKEFPASPCYFEMHTPLIINSDGTYTTHIFRKFASERIDYLNVKLIDFEGWKDTVAIAPIELNNIHPDTIVIQDIYLESNEYIITTVENVIPIQSEEFTLINYPNPFNSSTNFFIKMSDKLQEKSGTIRIYSTTGQLVQTIILATNKARWNGTDKNGVIMPSGIYYYQVKIDKQIMKSGSMILLR